MERFDFSFGLYLGGRLHSHADNLSKDLKGTKVAAVSGQGLTLAYLTKETLKKMPSDQSFDHFYANISRKSEGLLGKPSLPLKAMHFGQTGDWCWCTKLPQTAKDHFRRVYCEAVDLMVSAIYQESFSSYAHMETLWLKLLMVTTMSSSCLKHIQRRR